MQDLTLEMLSVDLVYNRLVHIPGYTFKNVESKDCCVTSFEFAYPALGGLRYFTVNTRNISDIFQGLVDNYNVGPVEDILSLNYEESHIAVQDFFFHPIVRNISHV